LIILDKRRSGVLGRELNMKGAKMSELEAAFATSNENCLEIPQVTSLGFECGVNAVERIEKVSFGGKLHMQREVAGIRAALKIVC
jgi:hypothetical protein